MMGMKNQVNAMKLASVALLMEQWHTLIMCSKQLTKDKGNLMGKISDIVKQIESCNQTLELEIESIPWGHRPSVHIAKRKAEEKLVELKRDLKDVVIPGSLISVFATGDDQAVAATAELLLANGGVVLNGGKMYNDIVGTIEPSYGAERMFCTTQYGLLVKAISEMAQEFEYEEISPPPFREKMCKTRQDTFNHVVSILRECNVGPQLNKDFLTRQTLNDIIKGRIDSKLIPVLVVEPVTGLEGSLLHSLFSKSIDFEFPVGFEPTAKKVTAIFKGEPINDE
jgi:hypothetical protein